MTADDRPAGMLPSTEEVRAELERLTSKLDELVDTLAAELDIEEEEDWAPPKDR